MDRPDDTRTQAAAQRIWERAVWDDIKRHLERRERQPLPPKPDDVTKLKGVRQ